LLGPAVIELDEDERGSFRLAAVEGRVDTRNGIKAKLIDALEAG
jgi:hypothetical protein